MPEAVTVDGFRERIAAHMAGIATLPRIAYIAFGDGGHESDNTPKNVSEKSTALYHETVRKSLTIVYQEDSLSATGKGIIDSNEIPSAVISEAGLIDAEGNLIGWKTFAPKYVEDGETYGIKLKLRF